MSIKYLLLTTAISSYILLAPSSSYGSITCECNPATFKEDKAIQYYEDTPYYNLIKPDGEVIKGSIQKTAEKVVRAAIDIGSGATKLRVAKVDLNTHKIDEILINESYTVHYQEQLAKSHDNRFSEEVMQQGIDAIKKSAEVAQKYNAEKVVAVATASFRSADNSQEFIDRIYKETGVTVYVIDQDLEGKLAFNAVMAQGGYPPEGLVVWDIGGGSLQLTGMDKEGLYQIFRGDVASIHFKNIIIDVIQQKDPKVVHTPNPMTLKEIQDSTLLAKDVANRVDQVFKDRIARSGEVVVGVGNIFAYGLYPVVGKKSPFTQEDLRQAVHNMADKTDADLGGGDYANVQVSNLILILGYMEKLGLNEMQVVDVNNADGAVLYEEFWK